MPPEESPDKPSEHNKHSEENESERDENRDRDSESEEDETYLEAVERIIEEDRDILDALAE